MKRIISPVLAGFSLLIVGAIITNSIIDGEQLVIKFLATVVVAAIGLYIISDLRLRQSENSAILSNQSASIGALQQTESGQPNMPIIRSKSAEQSTPSSPPSNSTAAFMAKINKRQADEAAKATDNRSYSAMGRIKQKRRNQPATNDKQLVDVATKSATEVDSAPLSPSPVIAERLDVEETTIDAAPLETLRVEGPIDGLLPSQGNSADTMPPGVYGIGHDSGANLTSILQIPAEADIPSNDDTPEDISDIEDLPAPFDIDDIDSADEKTDEPANQDSSETDTADRAEELVAATNPERRRFTPEDINIADLRAVDLEEVREQLTKPAPTSPKKTQSKSSTQIAETQTASALDAINDAIADGERSIIGSLIERGVLSEEGPITDDDVTTMIYVAFTSSELRKILQDGGTMDTNNGEISLEGLGIYTTDDLASDDKFLVVGPDEAVSQLANNTST